MMPSREESQRLAAWTAIEWRRIYYALATEAERAAYLEGLATRYGVHPAQVRQFLDDPAHTQAPYQHEHGR